MDSDKFKIFFLEALSDDTVVKKQQAVLRPVVDRLSNALDEIVKSNQVLKKRLEEKDAEIGALNKQVATLELKVDAMEQWGRKGSVRIHGLSEDTEGTVEQKVLDLVNNGMKLRPPLTLDEIEVAHRLPGGRSQARQGPQRAAASPGPSRRAHDGAGGDDDGNNDGEDDATMMTKTMAMAVSRYPHPLLPSPSLWNLWVGDARRGSWLNVKNWKYLKIQGPFIFKTTWQPFAPRLHLWLAS